MNELEQTLPALTPPRAAGGPLPPVRELPPEEWERLLPFPPFDVGGLPAPEYNRIIVAELGGPGGEIVAYWMVLTCVHTEPVWIHPEHRSRPGLIRRLWGGVRDILREANVTIAFACITDADAVRNVPLAMRLGFEKLAGDLFYIRVGDMGAPPAPPKE